MDKKEKHEYIMSELMKLVNKPRELTDEQRQHRERIEKMKAEALARREGSIYDVMPEEMQKEQMKNQRKYGFKIPPPEEL